MVGFRFRPHLERPAGAGVPRQLILIEMTQAPDRRHFYEKAPFTMGTYIRAAAQARTLHVTKPSCWPRPRFRDSLTIGTPAWSKLRRSSLHARRCRTPSRARCHATCCAEARARATVSDRSAECTARSSRTSQRRPYTPCICVPPAGRSEGGACQHLASRPQASAAIQTRRRPMGSPGWPELP